MSEDVRRAEREFNDILLELVTNRAFSALDFDGALLYFCQVLATSLEVQRVGVWALNDTADEIHCRVQWDRGDEFVRSGAVLSADDAGSYLEAVMGEYVVEITDALNDPRCVELAKEYLPSTDVRALLDCPLHTFGGLDGVVCIEMTGSTRVWTPAEVNFSLAVAGLISLTIEHQQRLAAEQSAIEIERRFKVYTDLSEDWFWETDEHFVFESVKGRPSLGGQNPGEFVNKKVWEFGAIVPLTGSWDALRKTVASRRRIHDFIVSQSDGAGNTYYGELAGLPKFDPQGNFKGYWGTVSDVTSRIRRELNLEATEQKYRNASRLAKLGSWIWDEIEDRAIYCSPELAEIYGVTDEEYLRRSSDRPSDLLWFHEDDRDRYDETISRAVENQSGYEITTRIVRDDGSVRTLHETAEPVFDAAGTFIATTGVLLDISEQVDLREQLRTNEARLSSIVDNIAGAIYRVKYDEEFTPIYRSAGFIQLFVDPTEPRDSRIADAEVSGLNIDHGDRERIDTLLVDSVASGQPYEFEYAVTLSDGSDKWVSDRGRPIENASGGFELEGIIIDVTDRHRAEEALSHRQRLDAIGQMTGGIAHDFNNLLAVILGNLEFLRQDVDNAEQLELIDAGINATLRGADLTKSMLAFARKTPLKLEALDLNDLAVRSNGWIGRTLPENITVSTSLTNDLWQTETDANSTESAVLNLILNARDSMPSGGNLVIETANVSVDDGAVDHAGAAIAAGRYATLTITDTGHGITPDVLENIFEPFYTTKPVGSGSGLGLSMIQDFMKQLGGSVRVTSEPDVGTAVTLLFRALAHAAPEKVHPLEREHPSRSRSARILVVEDDPNVRHVVRSTLAAAGYDIDTATSGDEAFAIFETDSAFDLLVTDIVMPGRMQGIALAEALREKCPGLRVVFVSGYAGEGTAHERTMTEGDVRLMKPVLQADLISAVEDALG